MPWQADELRRVLAEAEARGTSGPWVRRDESGTHVGIPLSWTGTDDGIVGSLTGDRQETAVRLAFAAAFMASFASDWSGSVTAGPRRTRARSGTSYWSMPLITRAAVDGIEPGWSSLAGLLPAGDAEADLNRRAVLVPAMRKLADLEIVVLADGGFRMSCSTVDLSEFFASAIVDFDAAVARALTNPWLPVETGSPCENVVQLDDGPWLPVEVWTKGWYLALSPSALIVLCWCFHRAELDAPLESSMWPFLYRGEENDGLESLVQTSLQRMGRSDVRLFGGLNPELLGVGESGWKELTSRGLIALVEHVEGTRDIFQAERVDRFPPFDDADFEVAADDYFGKSMAYEQGAYEPRRLMYCIDLDVIRTGPRADD